MSKESLKDFHRRRVQILAKSGADLIAFETIPNKLEAEVDKVLLNFDYFLGVTNHYTSLPSGGPFFT